MFDPARLSAQARPFPAGPLNGAPPGANPHCNVPCRSAVQVYSLKNLSASLRPWVLNLFERNMKALSVASYRSATRTRPPCSWLRLARDVSLAHR